MDPFTITNKETGLCLRARLADSKDVGDYKEGMKYLMSVTAPPVLELGPADGSLATAWYFHTADDPSERQPFNQIASVAVRDLQNIGNYCVWLDAMDGGKCLGELRQLELPGRWIGGRGLLGGGRLLERPGRRRLG
ncbi:hypothetical protein [Streptomyces chryseus]|uniref:hypothetical protein n=1 Tax=Streptomyces chryseus TaxID=68186 RepID=UPI00110F6E90|nr:hypothetical protein [Streptomyces chryseus]GGX47622.1 hypothetical protein GCM10010353_72270 [Streptomyces chryseus]